MWRGGQKWEKSLKEIAEETEVNKRLNLCIFCTSSNGREHIFLLYKPLVVAENATTASSKSVVLSR